MIQSFKCASIAILAFENNFDNGGSGEWHYYPESSVNAQPAAR
jgi:hypothetical protein